MCQRNLLQPILYQSNYSLWQYGMEAFSALHSEGHPTATYYHSSSSLLPFSLYLRSFCCVHALQRLFILQRFSSCVYMNAWKFPSNIRFICKRVRTWSETELSQCGAQVNACTFKMTHVLNDCAGVWPDRMDHFNSTRDLHSALKELWSTLM